MNLKDQLNKLAEVDDDPELNPNELGMIEYGDRVEALNKQKKEELREHLNIGVPDEVKSFIKDELDILAKDLEKDKESRMSERGVHAEEINEWLDTNVNKDLHYDFWSEFEKCLKIEVDNTRLQKLLETFNK